jgi:hypothetical protein
VIERWREELGVDLIPTASGAAIGIVETPPHPAEARYVAQHVTAREERS